MTEKKVRRPGQVYLAGAAWIVGALLFPVYRLWGLALTALLSLGAYWLGGRLFPPKVYKKRRSGYFKYLARYSS